MFSFFRKSSPDNLYIIMGLGNIGPRYRHTRHNIGFDATDLMANELKISIAKRQCNSLTGEARIEGKRILLAQPQTYMNESGRAAAALLRFYKLEDLSRFIVIYDDIDLPLAAVRVRPNGGAGTHNGMRSLLSHTGDQQFPRVRVGIGKPADGNLVDYVTGKFSKEHREAVAPALEKAAAAAKAIVFEGIEAAMRTYNAK